MILKKPYAFFIRFFKLFHLIIFALSSVLLYRTSLVYNFMKEFCKDSPNVIGKDLVSPLFVWWVYLLIIIIILVNLLIIYILVRKIKPYMYYVVNIFLYMGVMIVFVSSHRIIGNMQSMLVAAKTTLAIRDFLNLARLFQTVSVIFYLIRATGFDIKKFDFVRDLQGLDISPEDSEEIEVAVEFEGNVLIRNIKRRYRDFKYYYKENKFLINIFSLLFVGILFFFIYFNINKYNKVYSENQFFNVSGYNIGVKKSSILNTDFMGNVLSDEEILVVVNFSVNGFGNLPASKFVLVADNMQYYPISGYDSSVRDLGSVYSNQILSSEFSDYLFVYKIPKSSMNSNFIFRCIDNVVSKHGKTVVNSIDIKLNPTNYIGVGVNNYDYALGEEISIDNYKVMINSYDINRNFTVMYNSCISTNECYDLREVLNPSVIRNREKVLLRVDGSLVLDDSSKSLYNFISQFGSIEYVYNGNSFIEYGDFNSVISTKSSQSNVYYIEVDKEIMDASYIKLNFNFRDKKYSYILRGDIGE